MNSTVAQRVPKAHDKERYSRGTGATGRGMAQAFRWIASKDMSTGSRGGAASLVGVSTCTEGHTETGAYTIVKSDAERNARGALWPTFEFSGGTGI